MLTKKKITSRDYYDTHPVGQHATGDIWRDLPTYGLLKADKASGIVITPACDLANRKVGTITYIPILPIQEYLVTTSFYTELRAQMNATLSSLGLEPLSETLADPQLPQKHELDALSEQLRPFLESKDRKMEKTRPRVLACQAGLLHLRAIFDRTKKRADMGQLSQCFGTQYQPLLQKLVRNSLRTDIHFLPADGEDASWSALQEHAVALFRYPLTAPVEVFNLAQDTTMVDWAKSLDALGLSVPLENIFYGSRPLKTARLRPVFLTDLLTRFLGLYIRMGSPDFTEDTVSGFCQSIGGGSK